MLEIHNGRRCASFGKKFWFSVTNAGSLLNSHKSRNCSVTFIWYLLYVRRKKKVKGILFPSCPSCVPEKPIYIKSFPWIALKFHPLASSSSPILFLVLLTETESGLKVKKAKSVVLSRSRRVSVILRRIIRKKRNLLTTTVSQLIISLLSQIISSTLSY